MGASNLKLVLTNSTWKCNTFHNFLSMLEKKDFQTLAGLWLAGEVVNHIGIYGFKAAEGLSAFQHRSCDNQHLRETFFVYKHSNALGNDRACANTDGNAGVDEITGPQKTPDSTIYCVCVLVLVQQVNIYLHKGINKQTKICKTICKHSLSEMLNNFKAF